MALKLISSTVSDPTQLQLALATASFEANYERSKRAVEVVCKEEEIRKLKVQLLLLEDDNEGLHEQLEQEQDRGDKFEHELEDALVRAHELDAEVVQVTAELRIRTRELENTKAEILSLGSINSESAKLMTDKLALAREVSVLKPEVEHLRSQLASNSNLLSEKLALQRQLSSLEVELDNEKRSKQRLQEKNSKKSMDRRDAAQEHEADLDDLRQSLKEEKELQREAKKDVERLRAELDEQMRRVATSRNDVEAAKADSETLDELRRALAREKREREKAERRADLADKKADRTDKTEKSDSAQVDELQRDLAKEKKERQLAEKGLAKAQAEWAAQKELQNDKLNQFRIKLKSTKEALKEKDEELEKAKAVAANAMAVQDFNGRPGPKNSRKRPVDPDATMGTPGDGPQPKRSKPAKNAAVGEKSSFSMTPFLNRASSVAITSPFGSEDEAAEQQDDAVSPTAAGKKAAKKASAKAKPLAPAPSSKINAKATKAKKSSVAVPKLEKVAEESTSPNQDGSAGAAGQENVRTAAGTSKIALGAAIPKLKPSGATKKPRKSIHLYASFDVEPEPERKKKRKLLGQSFGKTLFDEDDEDGAAAKPIPGRGLFAGRSVGGALGKVGMGKGGAPLITAPDGFQFSPLKRERRAGSVQPSFLG